MSVIDLTADSGESDNGVVRIFGSSGAPNRCSSSSAIRSKKPMVRISSSASADDQDDDAVMIIDLPKKMRVKIAASKGKM